MKAVWTGKNPRRTAERQLRQPVRVTLPTVETILRGISLGDTAECGFFRLIR
jgi:hypothetical protein